MTRRDGRRIEGEYFRTGCIHRRKIAFSLEFDRKWTACEELPRSKPDELPRYVLSFDLPENGTLSLKMAFSVNSPEAARRNLVSSIPAWDLDGVKSRAREAWNDILGRATCEGAAEQKKNWYTSLYHLYFQPNDYSDEGDGKSYYTTLSLWDTFRACHPWYSIVVPEMNAGSNRMGTGPLCGRNKLRFCFVPVEFVLARVVSLRFVAHAANLSASALTGTGAS